MSVDQQVLQPVQDTIDLVGELRGHGGWVTSIATSAQNSGIVLSSSRDRSVIVWDVSQANRDEYGFAKKRLVGHDHYVQDVVISSDGQFALTGSWDSTLRLWDLKRGVSAGRFVGHKKDVLSVSFSADNRRIVSGSRDKTIILWNTLGEAKFTISHECHTEWVSCVRFSPSQNHAYIVSAGWDKLIKVWDVTTCKLTSTFYGHTGYINALTTAPDGSLCASGGQDGKAMLWDLHDRKFVDVLDCGDIIHALAFSPTRFWMCAATASSVIVWDLENKTRAHELHLPEAKNLSKRAIPIQAISLAWSPDGNTLYVGYTDNLIRIWKVRATDNE